MKDDNKKRINWLIKGVILLAVILIAAMVAIDVWLIMEIIPTSFFLKICVHGFLL